MKARTILTVFVILVSLTVCHGVMAGEHMKAPGDIVAVAAGNENFSTLVKALKAAGLVETLQGEGPFTVFAPTNEAFGKLPEGTLENLLKPENKMKLTEILTYHVVPGKVMAADIKPMKAKAVSGMELDLKVGDDGVMVNDANVEKADILASNGVIHVIDTVLLPKAPENKPEMK